MRSTQLLNQMSGAFEQVVQHCWKRKKMSKACWKRVESNLNWFKFSFNVDSTFSFFLKMLYGVEIVWTPRSSNICPTSVQLLLNECWSNVEIVWTGLNVTGVYMIRLSYIWTASERVQLQDISYFHSNLFILRWFIGNSQNDQLPVGLIASVLEHCTSIAEVMGSNPVQDFSSQMLKLRTPLRWSSMFIWLHHLTLQSDKPPNFSIW